MRVLIVEDEQAIREQLCDFFTELGFVINAAEDGPDGLYYGEEYDYDLAIIDLGLPGLDGISLIEKLRAKDKNFPILILTARGHWQDKVRGLEAGADDYLVKPFHIEELKARAHALIRRAAGKGSSVLKFGPVAIDTASKTVKLSDEPIELTSFEYNTLEYLALNAGKPISKTELTEHLYHQDYERDSNVIEVFIGRLRKKLDPDNTLQPIQTLRGQGYKLSPDLN